MKKKKNLLKSIISNNIFYRFNLLLRDVILSLLMVLKSDKIVAGIGLSHS